MEWQSTWEKADSGSSKRVDTDNVRQRRTKSEHSSNREAPPARQAGHAGMLSREEPESDVVRSCQTLSVSTLVEEHLPNASQSSTCAPSSTTRFGGKRKNVVAGCALRADHARRSRPCYVDAL